MHCDLDSQIGFATDVRGFIGVDALENPLQALTLALVTTYSVLGEHKPLASCKTLAKRNPVEPPFFPCMRLERRARGGERYLGVQRRVAQLLFLHPPRKNKVVHWRPLNARRRVSASRCLHTHPIIA